MPSLPTSVRTAGFILLALLAYFVFRGVTRAPAETIPADQSAAASEDEAALPEVIVNPATSSPRQIVVALKGSSEPDREVTVRSETMGTVSQTAIREGQIVERGTVLCGLDVESRAARIAETEAAVASARLDYAAARQLQEKGWTTSNRAAATKAALDGAEAALAAGRALGVEIRINRGHGVASSVIGSQGSHRVRAGSGARGFRLKSGQRAVLGPFVYPVSARFLPRFYLHSTTRIFA